MHRRQELVRITMKTNRLLLALIMLLLLAACSSPPRITQSPAKAAADNTLKLAHSLEQKQNLKDAYLTYQSAYQQYCRFASFKGKLYSLSGMARIAYLEDDDALLKEKMDMMEELVRYGEPGTDYIPLLVNLYILQDKKDYQSVREEAKDSYDYPIDARIQILSYKLQADSYLNPGFKSAEYDDLDRLSKRYRRSLKTDFSADPSLLSGAYYALAYQDYKLNDLRKAEKSLDAAIDLDFLHENFPGLGYGYWLKGKINLKNDDKPAAISNFMRAQSIFKSLGMKEMLDNINIELEKIKGTK